MKPSSACLSVRVGHCSRRPGTGKGPSHVRQSRRYGLVGVALEAERSIAAKFAEGLTYQEIGAALFIAPTTVRTHLAAIYRKLDVHRPQPRGQPENALLMSSRQCAANVGPTLSLSAWVWSSRRRSPSHLPGHRHERPDIRAVGLEQDVVVALGADDIAAVAIALDRTTERRPQL